MAQLPEPGASHDLPFWYWRVVVICAPLALVFGAVGFWIYDGRPSGAAAWLNALYHAAQLFVLHMPHLERHVNWCLETGRWLAAVSSVMTAAITLLRILGAEALHLSLRFIDDHLVICGLDLQTVGTLKEHAAETASRMVVIAPNPTPTEQAECRRRGAVLVVADPADPAALARVRVHRARALVAICPDDNTNVATVIHARELVESHGNRRTTPLRCRVQLADVGLRASLQRAQTLGAGRVDVRFFDLFDTTARRLLLTPELLQIDRGGILATDSRQAHLVILGFGRMGRSLAVRAAQLGHFANGTSVRLTVIDRAARRHEQALLFRYPNFARTCCATFHELDVESAGTLRLLHEACEGAECLTSIAVCFDGDSLAAEVALRLAPILEEHRVQMAVRICDPGLASLIEDATQAGSRSSVRVYSVFEGRDAAAGEAVIEELAKAIHDAFRGQRVADGRSRATDPSIEPWPELTEDLKDSNRQQAAHLLIKLRGIGCESAAFGDERTPVVDFQADEIEVLAKMEHERWLAERWLAGWTAGPKDVVRKRSPYLMEWGGLPDDVKEYDRQTAKLIPALLRRMNKKVSRVSAGV